MGDLGGLFLFLLIVLVLALLVLGRWDPETRLAVLTQRLVLTAEVNGLALVAVLAALGKVAGAGGELGADGSVLLDPVGECVFAVLDDATDKLVWVLATQIVD